MPFYFEPEEIQYLREIMAKRVPTESWRKDTILGKLDSEVLRFKEIADCKHEFKIYTGEKEMCCKCGHLFKMEWSLAS